MDLDVDVDVRPRNSNIEQTSRHCWRSRALTDFQPACEMMGESRQSIEVLWLSIVGTVAVSYFMRDASDEGEVGPNSRCRRYLRSLSRFCRQWCFPLRVLYQISQMIWAWKNRTRPRADKCRYFTARQSRASSAAELTSSCSRAAVPIGYVTDIGRREAEQPATCIPISCNSSATCAGASGKLMK